jgi:hypothetical protein
MILPIDDGTFTIHRVTILLDDEGSLDDRLILDATGPDGERREQSIRDWHVYFVNVHNEESWRCFGARMLKLAHRVEGAELIRGARRDHDYIQL